MLRNYLTITSRIIRRHKMFSFINIAGLAAGIACCILISIWVREERSTDRFHESIDRIFLVRSQFGSGQEVNSQSGTPPLLGPALASEYPEVLGAARLFNWQPEILMKRGDVAFRQEVLFADPALFDVFTFPIARGEKPRTPSPPAEMVVKDFYLKLLGNGRRVGLFSLVAVLVLLMACINFANLSSARSDRRALEVGIRKTAGAGI